MSYFNAASWIARLLLLATLCLTAAQPAWSAKVPSDNEQEILIRTTLMTFNDANLTGNYAVLHAKTAVIDGRWSTVGSTNMDTRSFLHNSEVNVIVIDNALGSAMEAAFAEDLNDSDEVHLEAWRQRPLLDRLKEWASQQFDYWL